VIFTYMISRLLQYREFIFYVRKYDQAITK